MNFNVSRFVIRFTKNFCILSLNFNTLYTRLKDCHRLLLYFLSVHQFSKRFQNTMYVKVMVGIVAALKLEGFVR